MSQVMLTTPLLGVLGGAYPQARFDWAVGEWARPAVATHPRVGELVDSGRVGLPGVTLAELNRFAGELREREYDTCFIPSSAAALAYVAWRAGIPQRVGLDDGGRGSSHTIGVRPPAGAAAAEAYLALAEALGLETGQARMAFYPTDAQRNAALARLTDELGWDGRQPIVVIHPGGGRNPVWEDNRIRWPVERFALLGNRLVRDFKALVLLAGGGEERDLTRAVSGIMSSRVLDLAGQVSLGELGALCELAALYVGNDAGPTHIAAAVGCPTIAIYGPTNATYSRPHAHHDRLIPLWEPFEGEFSWEKGVSVAQVVAAAQQLLADG